MRRGAVATCARYEFSGEGGGEKIAVLLEQMEKQYPGRYKTGEICPGDSAPGIIARRDRLVPVPAVFGFPGFGDGRLLLNARSETAGEKRTFAEALRERRILLPAVGFFEWGRDPARTKYRFTPEGAPVFFLCGLYGVFEDCLRFVILTRPANGSMIGTHDRMPVLVGESQVRPYLTDLDAARALIAVSDPVLIRREA